MTVSDNKIIVRRAFEALMVGDPNGLAEALADDCTLHQCGFLQPMRGASTIVNWMSGGGRLSDRRFHLERVIGEGDIVAVHWSTSGRLRDQNSVESDGIAVSFPSMSFLRLDGSVIVEIWNIQDVATLQSQMDDAVGSE